ncbi:MAG: DUF2341 domain-containing protein [Dissulfuribacterales bacterium]
MKRLLIILFLMSSVASASDFNVTWTPVKEDIVNKEYIITIQNLDTDMRTVDVNSFFEDTNFDTSKIRDVEFYEQTVKPVKKEIKHYKTIKSLKTISHIDNRTGKMINTTKIVDKWVLDYIETKTVNEKSLIKQKTEVLKNRKILKEVSHGKITLPSVKTKGKINNKGTKTFILKFKTPPDGSHGKVGLKISGKEYHPYWNSTWSNRKKITLTGTSSGSQTDYQLLLNVTYEPEMNSDFSDVRFCNDTDQFPAWLESKVNESYALIWVKFPHTPADGETEDYWMYYGNSGAEENWNGDETFKFFDDFEGTNLNTEKWDNIGNAGSIINNSLWILGQNKANPDWTTKYIKSKINVGNNIVITQQIKDNNTNSNYNRFFERCDFNNNKLTILYSFENLNRISLQDGWSGDSSTCYWNGSFQKIDLYFKGTDFELFYNNISKLSHTYSGSPSYIAFAYNDDEDGGYVDNIHVRKYASPEPTYSFGDTGYYVDSIYFNSGNPYYNLIDYKGNIALNHSYSPSDNLDWTAQAVDNDCGLVVTAIGSSEIDFTTYDNVLDWLRLDNLDDSKIYTLQNNSGDLEEHQSSGNVVNFTTDLSPDDYKIEITDAVPPTPTPEPSPTPELTLHDIKLSDNAIKSLYYPFMYIFFIVIIIGGFIHVFSN